MVMRGRRARLDPELLAESALINVETHVSCG